MYTSDYNRDEATHKLIPHDKINVIYYTEKGLSRRNI
jgi:hypothetical protein